MQRKYVLAAMVATASWLGLPGAANAIVPTSSCATPDSNVSVTTCYYDLTASPSSSQSPTSAVLNGGIFRTPAVDGELGKGFIVGTGVFQPFVRIQEPANGSVHKSNGIESGFNTDAKVKKLLDDHDNGGTNWNHSIQLRDVPKVTVCDGGGATGENCNQYYEFLLDINEPGNTIDSGLSLDEFKLFWAGTGDLSAYTGADDTLGFTGFDITGATLAYDMDASEGGDASILMDYRNFSGSGNGVDLQALVPVASLLGASPDSYLYLYSKFGATGKDCISNGQDSPCKTPDGTTGAGVTVAPKGSGNKAGSLQMYADAGFEEWSIRKNTVDLPPTALLFGIGLMALVRYRKTQLSAA